MPRDWKMPTALLCATDLTPAGDRALGRAVQLAGQWQASLLVIHVIADANRQTNFTTAANAIEAQLRQKLVSNAAASTLEVEVSVGLGDPAQCILEKGGRLFADMLVLGAGEHTSFRDRLLGSTVDHVLRHALQPVLTVRNHVDGPYRVMAIATDFSTPSADALDCALGLFPETAATVIHVCDDALHGLLPSDRVTGPLAERHTREMKEIAEQAVAQFVHPALARRPHLTTAIEIGSPDEGVRRYVERTGADLAVIGTNGRTGWRRAVLGSVAERLIGTLACDVLAVRPNEST